MRTPISEIIESAEKQKIKFALLDNKYVQNVREEVETKYCNDDYARIFERMIYPIGTFGLDDWKILPEIVLLRHIFKLQYKID